MPPMVLSPRNQARLDAAAAPVLESIRCDRKLAPPELKPLLAYIEAHLFDPDFSVREMMRECGIRDNSVSSRFRRQTDMRPMDYVREHRLRVARELLKFPEPPIGFVAEMASVGTAQILSRNFRKRFGIRPSDQRKACAVADPGAGELDWSAVELQYGLEGKLEAERGRELARALASLYPSEGEAAETAPEADLATKIWQRIRSLPPEEELPAMREELATACRQVFELLCRKARVEGRRSRRRGVRLIERALECLDLCASVLGDELPGLKALGWARLGNALRLALDFPAAEEAFRRSAFEWSIIRYGERDHEIEAEILHIKAAFRTMQHRFEEAKVLVRQTLKFLEPDRQPQVFANTLVVRGSIAFAEGDPEPAIVDFKRALEFLEPRDGRMQLTVCHNLVAAYVEAGYFAEADELLPRARELCAAHGEVLEQCQLRWVEGRVAKGLGNPSLAEECFHAARAGFSGAGESGYSAVAAVELAMLYCQQGRPEVARYAAEAIPLLDSFKIRSEALAARRLLAEGLARERLTPEILGQVRAVVSDLVWDPAVRLPTGG